MRIIAFIDRNGQPALGLRTGGHVANLTAAGLPATLEELLKWPDGLGAAREAASRWRWPT